MAARGAPGCPSGAPFDLVYHLTWRVCGHPLSRVLGIPLIIGPVGGGETLADVRGGRRAAARDRAQALARYRVEFDRRGRQVVQPLENPATHWETVTQLATSSSLIAVACLLRAGNAGWLTNR